MFSGFGVRKEKRKNKRKKNEKCKNSQRKNVNMKNGNIFQKQKKRSCKMRNIRRFPGFVVVLVHKHNSLTVRPLHETPRRSKRHNHTPTRVGALISSHLGDEVTPVDPGRTSSAHGWPNNSTNLTSATAHFKMVAEQRVSPHHGNSTFPSPPPWQHARACKVRATGDGPRTDHGAGKTKPARLSV